MSSLCSFNPALIPEISANNIHFPYTQGESCILTSNLEETVYAKVVISPTSLDLEPLGDISREV